MTNVRSHGDLRPVRGGAARRAIRRRSCRRATKKGVGSAGAAAVAADAAARRRSCAAADSAGGDAPRPAPRAPVPTVTIDFDGLQHRILAVPGVADAPVLELQAGAAGMVYFLEPARRRRWPRRRRRRDAASLLAARSARHRRSSTGVADYDVSADGHKLLYRARRRRRWPRRSRRRGRQRPGALPRRRRSQLRRTAGTGRLNADAAHVPRSEAGVQADLQRRLAQPARLSLRAEHARLRLAEDEGDVRRAAAVREPSRRSELSAST